MSMFAISRIVEGVVGRERRCNRCSGGGNGGGGGSDILLLILTSYRWVGCGCESGGGRIEMGETCLCFLCLRDKIWGKRRWKGGRMVERQVGCKNSLTSTYRIIG